MNGENEVPNTVGPTRIPIAGVRWIDDRLRGIIIDLIGRWPLQYVDWERCAKRLGLRVHLVPPWMLDHPAMKYDYALQRGHLAVPRITDTTQRSRWLAHEVFELLLGLEHLHPPIAYPPEWGSDHDVARAVEELHFGPRLPFIAEEEYDVPSDHCSDDIGAVRRQLNINPHLNKGK